MTSWEDIRIATQTGDTVALRAVAKEEVKPEARRFLTMLADIIDHPSPKGAPLKISG